MSSSPYVTPEALPSAHEDEILQITEEECAEIIAELARIQIRISKLRRFGRDEVQPGQLDSNSRRLAMEIGDFYVMVARLTARGLINVSDIADGSIRKQLQLAQFMQTNPETK